MTFTVTCRDEDGARSEMVVEAASRAECLAQCKMRGIVPISVKAGGGRVHDREQGGRGVQGPCIGTRCWWAVAAALLLAAGWGTWRWLATHEEAPSPRSVSRGKVSRALGQQRATVPGAPESRVEKSRTEKRLLISSLQVAAEAVTKKTNDTNRDVVSDLRVDLSKAKPMFSHPIQCELANYVTPGRDVPPPDRVSDAEALKAADTPIRYGFDEPKEVLEQKKTVEDLLMEMKEYINGGGHANDFFEKLQRRQELEGEAVAQVRRDVSDLLEKGDAVGAQAALDEYNKYLRSQGIPPVRVKRLERIKALKTMQDIELKEEGK